MLLPLHRALEAGNHLFDVMYVVDTGVFVKAYFLSSKDERGAHDTPTHTNVNPPHIPPQTLTSRISFIAVPFPFRYSSGGPHDNDAAPSSPCSSSSSSASLTPQSLWLCFFGASTR